MTGSAALRSAALSFAILAPLSCSRGQAAATPQPVTHTITMENMQFQPATLTVKAGDSVVWVNKDMFAHTATSKSDAFDSGQIAAGASWTFRTATIGEFPYVCALHPTMGGTLRVE
jgi:plastocyanin